MLAILLGLQCVHKIYSKQVPPHLSHLEDQFGGSGGSRPSRGRAFGDLELHGKLLHDLSIRCHGNRLHLAGETVVRWALLHTHQKVLRENETESNTATNTWGSSKNGLMIPGRGCVMWCNSIKSSGYIIYVLQSKMNNSRVLGILVTQYCIYQYAERLKSLKQFWQSR